MIEINLSTKGKEDISNFGGINWSLVNVKFSLLGIVLLYLLPFVISSYFESDITLYENEQKELVKENRTKLSELRKYDSIKDQVRELEEQQEALKAKITVIKKIIDKRRNPFNVLKYISENTPDDVWLTELELDNEKIKLLGYSTSWKSIADFIENIKSSIFFNGNVSYNKPEGATDKIKNRRVESFEITTEIVGF